MSDRQLKDIGLSPLADRVRGPRLGRATPDAPRPPLLRVAEKKAQAPMHTNLSYPPRRQRRGRVIALHCSGGGASQWCHLTEALGGGYAVLAPEQYGSEATGPWTGEHAFALADEAARVVALIDESDDKVHLVGHSYGGGVALNVALSRPDRIAGMALYEPTAFHLLRADGRDRRGGPRRDRRRGRAHGPGRRDRRSIAERSPAFVDYWNGRGRVGRPAAARAERADPLGAQGTARFPRPDSRSRHRRRPTAR